MNLAFYVLVLVWVAFSVVMNLNLGILASAYATGAATILLAVLLVLLGWKVFGPPDRV